MGDAYKVDDARFLLELTRQSAADDEDVSAFTDPCPPNIVRTLLQLSYSPSAVESKVIGARIYSTKTTYNHYFFGPQTFAYTAAGNMLAILNLGTELKVFPGEQVYIHREGHTAGSAMIVISRFLESSFPFYEVHDIQQRKVAFNQMLASTRLGNAAIGSNPLPGARTVGPGMPARGRVVGSKIQR